jgi:hypothetical protein
MGIAVKVLTPFFGQPQGIVIGRDDRPDALNAGFLNAVSANVFEYDDTHLGTVMHPIAHQLFSRNIPNCGGRRRLQPPLAAPTSRPRARRLTAATSVVASRSNSAISASTRAMISLDTAAA